MKNVCYLKSMCDVCHVHNLRTMDEILDMQSKPVFGLKAKVDKIRKEQISDKQQWLKLMLPAIIPNGTFFVKCDEGLEEYGSYSILDLDGIQGVTKEQLFSEPCVKAVYTSPRGNGYKIVFMHDNDDWELHSQMYHEVARYFEAKFSIELDHSPSALSSAHFLSYDETMLRKNDNDVVPFHYEPKEYERKSEICCPSLGYSDEKIVRFLMGGYRRTWNEDHKEGHRHKAILSQSRELYLAGIKPEAIASLMVESFGIEMEKEITRIVDWVDKKESIVFGERRGRIEKSIL